MSTQEGFDPGPQVVVAAQLLFVFFVSFVVNSGTLTALGARSFRPPRPRQK
jgi:hypothetical protein